MESVSWDGVEEEEGAVAGIRWGMGGDEEGEEGGRGGRGGRGMSILPAMDLASAGSGGSGISGRAVALPAWIK